MTAILKQIVRIEVFRSRSYVVTIILTFSSFSSLFTKRMFSRKGKGEREKDKESRTKKAEQLRPFLNRRFCQTVQNFASPPSANPR